MLLGSLSCVLFICSVRGCVAWARDPNWIKMLQFFFSLSRKREFNFVVECWVEPYLIKASKKRLFKRYSDY